MEKNKLKKFIIKTESLSLSRFIFKCLYSRNSGYYQKKKIGTDLVIKKIKKVKGSIAKKLS